jgi:thymidine kinase
VGQDTDVCAIVRDEWTRGMHVDYLIVDEAQFLSSVQVDQLAELADDVGLDVYCFGIATDFRSQLFPGTRRLFELADELQPVQVEVLCWCGHPAGSTRGCWTGRCCAPGTRPWWLTRTDMLKIQ